MAKRLAVLVFMLVAALSLVAPALAQESPSGTITVTGVVEVIDTDPDGNPAYGITDEATGEGYILGVGSGPGSPISGYEGERVTIDGVPRSAPGGTVLDIVAFAPVQGGGPSPGTSPDRFATLSFELTVEGEPPEDAFFFGNARGKGGFVRAPLRDPDGDGVYTGSTFFDRFPPGPVSPDSEPVSSPVYIAQGVQGAGPDAARVIEHFGTVLIDGDKTFESSVSFDAAGGEGSGGDEEEETVTAAFELTVKGEPPAGAEFFGAVGEGGRPVPLADPDGDGVYTGSTDVVSGRPTQILIAQGADGAYEVIRDFGQVTFDEDRTFRARINFGKDRGETTTPDPVTGGSDNSDSSPGSGGAGSSGGSGGSGSASGSADSGSGGSGSGGSGDSGSLSGGADGGMRGLLPSTGGGVTLAVLGAGVLLVLGGLLVRRIFR